MTILLVEQNVNMALKYANFAFLMENGRIVRADRPEVLREDEDVKEFYLGIAKETSVKGYKRYRRKVRFRLSKMSGEAYGCRYAAQSLDPYRRRRSFAGGDAQEGLRHLA